ncbi:hypothetical protein V5R04_15495 [Jonesiaceae bacterium BS-20]|uniref:Uncharacterized protein n=1 Tax=Jonesiaceae bacterium BS-20 TaxID=3120821 RepID=A0AAU7DUE6_9MICO
MRTQTIKALALDETAIGLHAVLETPIGEIRGGISDVFHPKCPCGAGALEVWIWINGNIFIATPETPLQLELTPTELAAVRVQEQDQAIAIARQGQQSSVEKYLGNSVMSAVAVDEAQAYVPDAPRAKARPYLRSSLIAVLAVVVIVAAVIFGVNAPALSGYTFLSMLLVAVAGGALLRALAELYTLRGRQS